MRFKAKLAPEHVVLLHGLIGPVSRLAGSGGGGVGAGTMAGTTALDGSPYLGGGGTVVHLDPDHVRMSTRGTGGGGGGASSGYRGGLGRGGAGGAGHGHSEGGGGADGEGVACFLELRAGGGIFLEHRIESAADDVIVFEVDLGQLRVALQSVLSALQGGAGHDVRAGAGAGAGAGAQSRRRSRGRGGSAALYNSMTGLGDGQGGAPSTLAPPSVVVLKLAKRNGGLPCLCVDLGASPRGGGIEVHHAIPVRIMRAAEMQYHLPPRISVPDVQLELPPDRPLKTVVERLRTISPHVYIDGSMDGELALRIDGDGASINALFSKLIPRFEDVKDGDSDGDGDGNGNGDGDAGNEGGERPVKRKRDEPARCTVKVDGRKLAACLQWQGSLGRAVGSAVLCLVENETLCLHCTLGPGSIGFFTYYIPVHYLARDHLG